MVKGQLLKCVDSCGSGYLTKGSVYIVTAGQGDKNEATGCIGATINRADGFNLVDDDGDTILQLGIDGLHGKFEVVDE